MYSSNDRIVIPIVKVHPSEIILYNEYVHNVGKSRKNDDSLKNLEFNRHHNKLSKSSKRKINLAIDYLNYTTKVKPQKHKNAYNFINHKLSFITLTLPAAQKHTDNEIKSECLNQFLTEAKQKWHMSRYVWKAEHQSNCNIHFHILTNVFIPQDELRNVWNRIISKLGYITDYYNNMIDWHSKGFQVRKDLLSKWNLKSQLRAYEFGIKTHWQSPNTTDIHNLNKVGNIKSYIGKYMKKDNKHNHIKITRNFALITKRNYNDNESVTKGALRFLAQRSNVGRLWGCSINLSNLVGCTDVIDRKLNKELANLKANPKFKVINGDYFSIIYINVQDLKKNGLSLLYNMFNNYITEKFSTPWQQEIQT